MIKTISLDNCCFNRPYDTQNEETVRLETEAKIYIQELIKQGNLILVWSFILDFENNVNPFVEQKESIREWKKIAGIYVPALEEIRINANRIQQTTGLKAKDSLHAASALYAKADHLLTTDKKMLKSDYEAITVINPVHFVLKFPRREKMRSETLIKTEGMKTLRDTLGLVDAEKFIMLIKREPFDYTEWQTHLWEGKSLDDIFNAAKELENK